MAAFEGCGQELGEFCVRRRIQESTFRWWRWRLGATAATAPAPIRMLPVHVVPAPSSMAPAAAEVVIAVGGVELRVPVGADIAYVADLVAELRGRC